MNLYDNFERADNTNGLAGSTLSGGGAVWEKVNGSGTYIRGANAGITGGKAVIGNSYFCTLIVAQSNTIEGELTYTRTATNADIQFIFRYVDSNNYILVSIQSNSNVGIELIQNGVATNAYGRGNFAIGSTLRIVLTAAHQITLFENGGQIHTSTITGLTTGTKHGFGTYESTTLLEEFNFVDSAVVAADPPVNTVPGSQTALTNTSKAITGISVNDVNGNLATTSLTASAGLLNVTLGGGATISAGANNSVTLTLSGTQTQINAALATLTYIHTTAGSFTITVLSTDSTGTPLTDTDTIAIVVSTPQNAPVNTVPSTQTTTTNTVFAITGISVNDVDGNIATTRLTVAYGKVTVSLAGGATITAGANNTATLTLSGTQTQINAALATTSYQSNVGFTGTDTLTVLSTDSTGTPLTDSDTVSIIVNALYAVAGADYNATGVLSNGVTYNGSGQWVVPAGLTSWTFSVTTIADGNTAEINELLTLSVNGVVGTGTIINSNTSESTQLINFASFEKSYELMTGDERTASASGGGYSAFAVSRADVSSPSYAIYSSATENGTYTLDADNQPYTPSAQINGLVIYDHRTLTVTDEISFPSSVAANTVALIADTAGQKELCLLNGIQTLTVGGETSKVLNNIGVATHYSVPIRVGQNESARIYALTSYGQDPTLRTVGTRYYKITPKTSAGAIKPLNEITAIPVSIIGFRNMPNPPRNVRVGDITGQTSNEVLTHYPDVISDNPATFSFTPSSKEADVTPSSFFSASGTIESGTVYKVEVPSTDGSSTPIRTLTLDPTTFRVTYSEVARVTDTDRLVTDYKVYAEKAGVKSLPVILSVTQGAKNANQVDSVALSQVSSTVKALMTLSAAAGSIYGSSTERNIYLIQLSGTLLSTITLANITVSAGTGVELLGESTGNGSSFYVQAGRGLVSFELTIPYTGGVGNSLTVRAGSRSDNRSGSITIT